jgi:hypothetical protein
VPQDIADEPVDVLLELPAESGLADAGCAEDADRTRAAILERGVEQLLDEG